MRYAIVANTSWNIFRFRLPLVRKLIAEHHDVILIAPTDRYSAELIDLGFSFFSLDELTRSYKQPWKDIYASFKLKQLLKKHRIEKVITITHKANILGGLATRGLNNQLIAMVTGIGYGMMTDNVISKIITQLYKMTSNRFNRIIFENSEDADFFVKRNIIPKAKAFAVLGCGVDTHYFKTTDSTKTNKSITFTFVGRLLKDKGLLEYISASKQILKNNTNVECKIVGQFDEKNPTGLSKSGLQSLLKDSRIEYLNFQDDILSVYQDMDCLVLPSYREGLSRTIMEAMSCERFVICSDVPGCRQAIDNGINGFLCKPRDVESLISTMKKFLKLDDSTRNQMAKQARLKAINSFEQEKIAQELYDIISQT